MLRNQPALAVTMLDWRDFGELYVAEMIAMAKALADHLDRKGVPVFKGLGGSTASHQFAVLAEPYGGGGQGRCQKFAQGWFSCLRDWASYCSRTWRHEWLAHGNARTCSDGV